MVLYEDQGFPSFPRCFTKTKDFPVSHGALRRPRISQFPTVLYKDQGFPSFPQCFTKLWRWISTHQLRFVVCKLHYPCCSRSTNWTLANLILWTLLLLTRQWTTRTLVYTHMWMLWQPMNKVLTYCKLTEERTSCLNWCREDKDAGSHHTYGGLYEGCWFPGCWCSVEHWHLKPAILDVIPGSSAFSLSSTYLCTTKHVLNQALALLGPSC